MRVTQGLGVGVRRGLILAAAAALCAGLVPCSEVLAQGTEMGAIATRDARVTGGLEVQGGLASLLSNVSVTAYNRDALIALWRGGHVAVCATSAFHLLRSGNSGALVFGLDRGALEIYSKSEPQDAILTPDVKFVPVTKGQLDLKLRVTREGDTCVDNSGAQAPVLNATDPFSSASYRILPGQHVLFVKGDLRKVVDHERSSCGCPPVAPTVLAGKPGQPLTAAQAASAAHPFPQAESVGLAEGTESANTAPAGTASSQVTTSFSYGGAEPPGTTTPVATGAEGTTGLLTPETPEPVAPEIPDTDEQGGFFHAIGHFFHRLFGGH